MKEYAIKITETLTEVVIMEASSAQEAKDKVQVAWENGDYILDAEHFQGVTFTIARGR